MGWSINIGKVAGTTVRIHLTFILLLAWIGIDSYLTSGAAEAGRTLIYVVSVFGCVLLHEFGHIFAARAYGVGTPDVTLWPFGGIARLASIPEVPRQELLIAIAGPAVNVVIAALLILFVGSVADPTKLLTLTDGKANLVTRLTATNLLLAAFNLIPAFPMDGGRVLRAVLASQIGFGRATELAARIGQWIAFGIGIIGLLGNPMLIIIAMFIYFAAAAEAQDAAVRGFSAGIAVSRAMMTQFATLPSNAQVSDAVELLLRTSQRIIPVVDPAGRLVGTLDIAEVVRALNGPGTGSVADIMTTNIPSLDRSAALGDAFRLLQERAAPAVAIIDGASRLVGLVTLETLGEMLMLHNASASAFDRMQSRP